MPDQGDIVLVPGPYTDLSSQKRRPVIVISNDARQPLGARRRCRGDDDEPGGGCTQLPHSVHRLGRGWKAHFDATSGSGSSALAVPEPGTCSLLLAVLGLAAIAGRLPIR
jgi:hypothetical protein